MKYYVYILSCPLTGDPKYVGQTTCQTTRFGQHIYYSRFNPNKDQKEQWIYDLLLRGMIPIYTIVCTCDSKKRVMFYERLLYQLLSEEFNLLNTKELT